MTRKAKKTGKRRARKQVPANLRDEIRQRMHSPECRIEAPNSDLSIPRLLEMLRKAQQVSVPKSKPIPVESAALCRLLSELSTCLWYLKTKYFKQNWDDEEVAVEDARSRLALRRLERGVGALKKCGVEIQDPTNQRYPEGGENMMRPLEFQPTVGLTMERISETVLPIVFLRDTLIQRGEVFVAVPKEDSTPGQSGDKEVLQSASLQAEREDDSVEATSEPDDNDDKENPPQP